MITIITNGLILVLLIGAIGYTYLMDLRVRKLLMALNELEPMVGQFSKAVKQSETSLKKFKQATAPKKHGDQTQKSADKAYKSINSKKKTASETNQKSLQNHVGQISLPIKSELVRAFFETAEKQKL